MYITIDVRKQRAIYIVPLNILLEMIIIFQCEFISFRLSSLYDMSEATACQKKSHASGDHHAMSQAYQGLTTRNATIVR